MATQWPAVHTRRPSGDATDVPEHTKLPPPLVKKTLPFTSQGYVLYTLAGDTPNLVNGKGYVNACSEPAGPVPLGCSGRADRPLGDRPGTESGDPLGFGVEVTGVSDPLFMMSAGLAEAIRAGVQ